MGKTVSERVTVSSRRERDCLMWSNRDTISLQCVRIHFLWEGLADKRRSVEAAASQQVVADNNTQVFFQLEEVFLENFVFCFNLFISFATPMVQETEMSTSSGDDVVVDDTTLKAATDEKNVIRRHDYLFKIIMLGDTQTGKTNLLSRWELKLLLVFAMIWKFLMFYKNRCTIDCL